MQAERLWEFPVSSTIIISARLIYPGADAQLLFDYHDDKKDGLILNSGIIFDMVQAIRHTSEMFADTYFPESYDYLVIIKNSEWVNELRVINKQIADDWDIKHYAIYLKSNGLFEFIASDYRILETREGRLCDIEQLEERNRNN